VRLAFPALPDVWGSADDLRNVFLHLLLNARDAMPNGGSIWLSADVLDDAVLVHVEDEGIGIAPALADRIFEPFFTTKKRDGTGIGLALARQTMRQAGGDITAKNGNAGGACFELRFALPYPPFPSAPAEDTGTSSHNGPLGISGC
jgi:signal transduction histidine kinase